MPRAELREPITNCQTPNFKCRAPSSSGQSPIFKHWTSIAEGRASVANHQLSNTELQLLRAELQKPITNHQMSRVGLTFRSPRLLFTPRSDISFWGLGLSLLDCITHSAYQPFQSPSAKDQSQITKCHTSHTEGCGPKLYTLSVDTSEAWYTEFWVTKGGRLSSKHFPRFTHQSSRAEGWAHIGLSPSFELISGSKAKLQNRDTQLPLRAEHWDAFLVSRLKINEDHWSHRIKGWKQSKDLTYLVVNSVGESCAKILGYMR